MDEKQKTILAPEIGKAALEHGVQALDQLMREHGLSNTDVVNASANTVTHKMVNKGRRGRRLSRKVQTKVHDAFCRALAEKLGKDASQYGMKDVFNYDGR